MFYVKNILTLFTLLEAAAFAGVASDEPHDFSFCPDAIVVQRGANSFKKSIQAFFEKFYIPAVDHGDEVALSRLMDQSYKMLDQIRDAYGVRSNEQNVLIAMVELNGKQNWYYGFSGVLSPEGALPLPVQQRVFKPSKVDGEFRGLDTEVKLLEEVHRIADYQSYGRVIFFSYVDICLSCQKVIGQFNDAHQKKIQVLGWIPSSFDRVNTGLSTVRRKRLGLYSF